MVKSVSEDELEKALRDCHNRLQYARSRLFNSPAKNFHDCFLESLQPFYEEYTHTQVDKLYVWEMATLQRFLVVYFPVYATTEAITGIWQMLVEGASTPSAGTNAVTISFEMLIAALKRDLMTRLLTKDPSPLESHCVVDANLSRWKGGQESDVELPRLQTVGLQKHRLSTTSESILLKDYSAEVLKKSPNWLGRWQTRYLRLRWNELEISKKNPSSFRHSIANSFPSQPTISSTSATTTGNTGSGGAKSKRYLLHNILSLQIIHPSDNDKKQALNLHFKQSTANGGNTTKSLTLGCEDNTLFQTVVSQVATFCLFSGLMNGESLEMLKKFIQVGAKLDVSCLIPTPTVPSIPLTPLQLALVQTKSGSANDFRLKIQLLIQAGADPRTPLQWTFANHALFSTLYGSEDEVQARRSVILQEKLGTVDCPFGRVIANDDFRWNLLMFFCCYGDFEAARQLLTGLYRKSRTTCLQYLDHVNSVGDTSLHIAIKASRNHENAEELAMLLVDIGTNTSNIVTSESSSTSDSTSGSIRLPLTSSSSYTDSQLIHCCDGNGETAFHLALKARLWKLADKLLDCKAVDPMSCDSHGNSSLHLAIKVGAPVPTIARIIHLYRPLRASSEVERSHVIANLGYEKRERHGNNTPLTLAIKYHQTEIVDLLLAAGASPNISDCHWSIATDVSVSTAHSELENHIPAIRDDDSPLHVAIKAGFDVIASSLVAYGAHIRVDSNGVSSLGLSIRHGMYALALKIARQLAEQNRNEWELKELIDNEVGSPVVLLAMKAGQLELASLLLDICSKQAELAHSKTKETLLHILISGMSPTVFDNATFALVQGIRSSGENQDTVPFNGSPRQIKRNRYKSRSEGNINQLRGPLLASISSSWEYSSDTNSASVRTSISEERDGANDSNDQAKFRQRVAESLVTGVLQRASDTSVITNVANPPHQQQHYFSGHHSSSALTSIIAKSQQYTSLHAAAAGGKTSAGVLCLLLAFALFRLSPSHIKLVEMFSSTCGYRRETPLHCAINSNAAMNALIILYCMQVVCDKRTECTIQWDQSTVTNAAKDDIKETCMQIYELATVPYGNTPLHLACMWPLNREMLHVVNLFLREEVYAGGWNRDGYAPLHLAIQHNCDDRLIRLFKMHGQDLNIWTEGSNRSRVSSSKRASLSIHEFTEGVDTYKSSIGERAGSIGSSLANNDIFQTPMTPLMLTIDYENAAGFRELVRCGAQVKVVTHQTRMSLLHLAAQREIEDRELLECLLGCKKLTQYEITDEFGMTTRDAVAKLKELIKNLNNSAALHTDTAIPILGESNALYDIRESDDTNERPSDNNQDIVVVGECESSDPRKRLSLEGTEQNQANDERFGNNSSRNESILKPKKTPHEKQHSHHELSPSRRSPAPSLPSEGEQLAPPQLPPFRQRPPLSGSTKSDTTTPCLDDESGIYQARTIPGALEFDKDGKQQATMSSPPRTPPMGAAQRLQSLPKPPSLDSATLEYLLEEEKATLTLVAYEARQEAKDWLKKRIGQKKLLSDARAQLHSAQKHKRTGSGNVFYAAHSDDASITSTGVSEQLLNQYKALAAKKFVDKHVAEAVAGARMEIEREKQAIFQETGLYPGITTSSASSKGTAAPLNRRDSQSTVCGGNHTTATHRKASSASSITMSSSTQISDEIPSVWWSDRGGTALFNDDGNLTWLSSSRGGTMLSDIGNNTWLSSTRGSMLETRDRSSQPSFLESEYGETRGETRRGIIDRRWGDESERRSGNGSGEYRNPLDRDSFSHVIEERKSS